MKHATQTVAATLLALASPALAADGWSLTNIGANVENSAFASYEDFSTGEHDSDWQSEARNAVDLSQLPLWSEVSAASGDAWSEGRTEVNASITEDLLTLECDSDCGAWGQTFGDYSATADCWSSSEVVATIRLDGPKSVHFRGGLHAAGSDAMGEARIHIERASDGLLISQWTASMSSTDIDLESTLASGEYRIRIYTGGFTQGGTETLPSSTIGQSAWLEASIQPMILDPDLNGDQVVNGLDLGLLFADWGFGNSPADLNLDGMVNGADMGLMFSHWK